MAGSGNESDRKVDEIHHDVWIARLLPRGSRYSPWDMAQALQQVEADWKRSRLLQLMQIAKDFGLRHDVWIAYWHSLGLPVPPMPPDDRDP